MSSESSPRVVKGRGRFLRAPLLLAPLLVSASFTGCQCTVYDDDDDGIGGFGGTSADGGAGGEDTDPGSCTIASITPSFGTESVAVAGETFVVTWDRPIDEASVQGAIRLLRLDDNAEISVQTMVVDERTVEVRPLASLRFWSDYGLEVLAIPATDGTTCTPQNTAFSTVQPEPIEAAAKPAPANGMIILGDFAIVASQAYRGLQVYQLGVADEPTLVKSLDTDQQPVAISTDGELAYVSAGWEGVLVFDVADPSDPKLLSVAGTPGFAQEAVPFVNGSTQYIAVADGPGGVRIIDMGLPAGPKSVSAFNPTGDVVTNVTGLSIEGDLLATGQRDQGFSLVDISTPSAPVVLASAQAEGVPDTFNQPGYVWDTALDGNILFLSLGQRGVEAFDITDRSAPTFIDHENGPQGICQSGCADPINFFTLDGGTIFASSLLTGAVRMHLEGDTLVTDATLPVVGHTFSVLPTADHLYATAGSGLVVFDRDAVDGAVPLFTESESAGQVNATAVSGNYLYAATAYRGLETYSLEDPLHPVLVDVDVTASIQRDLQIANVAIQGNRIVVLDGRAGVSVYDISTPENPVLTGVVDDADADHSSAIEFNGDLAYVCNDNHGLWVVDYLSIPPVMLNSVPLSPDFTACRDLELAGNRLVVGEGTALGVFDVSNPASPTILTQYILPNEDAVNGIELYGNHLLASTAVQDFEGTFSVTYRLVVFDMTDFANPKLVYRSDNLGGARTILRTGDKAFIAGGREGVFIFDLADPAVPYLEGNIEFPGLPASITPSVSNDILYVSERGRGVSTIDAGNLPTE